MNKLFTVVSLLLFTVLAHAGDLDLSNIDVNEFQNQLPDDFPKMNFSQIDAKTLVRDKCLKVAGEEKGQKAFDEIESSTLTLAECVNKIVNFSAVQEEIDFASPRGELDAVFNKHCLKRPDALQCIENFNSKLTPCLDKEERENQDVFMRIIRSLLNFVCHKGGDQIALFIAEEGPQCFESHKEDIKNCLNETFSGYAPEGGIDNVNSLPKFIIGPKQCADMYRLESCIVKKLETCEKITPANIVESMFRFIKNETICRSVGNKQYYADNASNSLIMSLNSLLTLVFLTLLYYFKQQPRI